MSSFIFKKSEFLFKINFIIILIKFYYYVFIGLAHTSAIGKNENIKMANSKFWNGSLL